MSSARPVIFSIRRMDRAVPGHQARQIPGAVADHRHGLFGERGKDQFARFAIGHGFQSFGVHDFGVEVIFPDVQPVFRFNAFIGHPRPHDFGKTININSMHIERLFDLGPHRVGPGFGPEDADIQRAFAGIKPLGLELLQDVQRVGRRDRDGRSA